MTPPTHTPIRTVRVGTPKWQAAKAKAKTNGETMADVINRAIDEYLATPDATTTERKTA